MSNQNILIIGGAGSLGKEFVRYLEEANNVSVVDNNEWAVAELKQEFPGIDVYLQDYDQPINGWFNHYIVCAAYKHVNLGESNIESFVDNNLNKLAQFYSDHSDGNFLYISTDKAVEPISVYGATKYIAEKLTWQYGGTVARCGNFLHSSGSVIPVWEKAISEGKPIPITDERMVRYVSNMDEAVKEIWEEYLKGEKLIVPTNRKVRVTDLLTDVLKKHGYMSAEAYKPGITVIGMRPGEKLEEKLLWSHEDCRHNWALSMDAKHCTRCHREEGF